METWELSVKRWKEIIDILNGLNINTTSFSRLKGLNKTRVYNSAILLSRNKIPSNHRGIIPRTIRRISNKCEGIDDREILIIHIPTTLCNLIRSQTPPS